MVISARIDSLLELEKYLERLPPGEKGILALDFDHTLVEGQPTLGDENFYHFLARKNVENGAVKFGHYHWTAKIREKIPFKTCESVEKINELIKNFREKGWKVKIFTARCEDMKLATRIHLKQSKLNISFYDVVFRGHLPKSHDGKRGGLENKGEMIAKYIKKYTTDFPGLKFRVLFADDSALNGKDVQKVLFKIQGVSIKSFHFIGALPSPHLTDEQLRRLAVQLHAHREDKEIVADFTSEDLELAMKELGLEEISEDTIYRAIQALEAYDSCPVNTTNLIKTN